MNDTEGPVSYNKIELVGEMLVEAAHAYQSASKPIHYINCILLSGAALGILTPLLRELGIQNSIAQLAKFAQTIVKQDEQESENNSRFRDALSYYLSTYNSLKHAGKSNKGNKGREVLAPADDLTICADFADEAQFYLTHAIQDFGRLPEEYLSSEYINTQMSDELLDVLHMSFSKSI